VLPVKSATLDGERVVDKRGLTYFELRSALGAVFLYVFDVLELDGDGLRRHPWEPRRATFASAKPAPASGCPNTLTARPAQTFSSTSAVWGSRVSWRSGGISPTARVGAAIGSR
jgi:hypothetical protein